MRTNREKVQRGSANNFIGPKTASFGLINFTEYRRMFIRRNNPMTMKYLFFGQHLQKKGLITFEAIYKARMMQKMNNHKIGELAEKRGWLTKEQMEKILVLQEEGLDKFGETAIKLGFLAKEQVEELLRHQKEEYIFFGEALVKLGCITEDQLIENLKEFNIIKFNRPV
jgi:hypothetical protein